MSYRSILVHTEDTVPGRMLVRAAVDLARRFDATLTGVFLRPEAIPAMFAGDMFSAVTLADSFLAERAGLIEEAARRASAMFEEAVKSAGVRSHWHEINGDDEAALTLTARRHDLVVLRREVRPEGGLAWLLASQVAMGSGGPVVIVPETGYPIPFGLNLLVAWKESRESARALRDALPFVEQAKSVNLVSVSADAPDTLDEFARRQFELHGAKPVKVIVDHNDDRAIADAIRLRSDMVSADMIVMGLYGHSRLQEFFLGGVSRHMLGDLTLPVLLSH
jgi:nucleotide-binding universal stress UspA family protein